jgi:hypothetical protein
VVTPGVVEVDEFGQPRFQLTRQVVVLEQDLVFQRAVVAFDFGCRWMLPVGDSSRSNVYDLAPPTDRDDFRQPLIHFNIAAVLLAVKAVPSHSLIKAASSW